MCLVQFSTVNIKITENALYRFESLTENHFVCIMAQVVLLPIIMNNYLDKFSKRQFICSISSRHLEYTLRYNFNIICKKITLLYGLLFIIFSDSFC